jgi:DNA gyrase subunit A
MAEISEGSILPVHLEEELRRSYIDYAMSVIVGRALPDVRDGLKPVQRRVLYAMHELGNTPDKPYKKSARVVGDVIGKYHPHGESAVYDTIVRMAQPFAQRYPLVDGQGNFGSVDGDAPAAMRYTEIRMARIAQEMLADIDADTVPFAPNYDNNEKEPRVLPARIPNLLINGASGIAVGMATNIPPHNLRETVAAALLLLDDPNVGLEELLRVLPGPDFPTGGILLNRDGLYQAYALGRGRVLLRGKTSIETIGNSGREQIVVSELPYQVNKAELVAHAAALVRDGRIEGVATIRDESDRDGMRVVFELRRGETPEVVLNQLYQHTALQRTYGINTVALVDGQPRTLGLKALLEAFLDHRRSVVVRRSLHQLARDGERAHVLEGLTVALDNLDAMIALVRAAPSPAEAREALRSRPWPAALATELVRRAGQEERIRDPYTLSEAQAKAILDLTLQRLPGLERDKIFGEYLETLERIRRLRAIVDDPDELRRVIREELEDVARRYGDARRTEISSEDTAITALDLIRPVDMVVTLSHAGYAKAQPLEEYRAQRRGGRGRAATQLKDDDVVERVLVANTTDTLLCFTTAGRLYWLDVHRLPRAGSQSKGKPLVNLLPLADGERVTAVLPIRGYDADRYVVFATRSGTVKKVRLEAFSRPRTNGIIALGLADDDTLVGVALTDGERDLMLVASNGKAIRFSESDLRPLGRTAVGVRGIRIASGEELVAMIVLDESSPDVLVASADGYGKRTAASDFPRHRRGGQGVFCMRAGGRNGPVVAALGVCPDDEVMVFTAGGTLVRTPVETISRQGRVTMGVRLIRLEEGDRVTGLALVPRGPEENLPGDEAAPEASETESPSS